jgi:hypothetical protein
LPARLRRNEVSIITYNKLTIKTKLLTSYELGMSSLLKPENLASSEPFSTVPAAAASTINDS